MSTSQMPGALSGLRVLDLSRILAGPTATQMLGDLGATVIKVENPKSAGDDTRSWGPVYAETADGESDLSAYFMSANRNKLSISIDMASDEGQALVRRLAAQADVVIENYKPNGLAKYGLDHETVRAAHPHLIWCSISGFGQTGPNRDRPGYDLMAQGFGGIMSLTGAPDGPPMKVGVGIADVMCGMYAAIGILAALRHRDAAGGEGQHIDLALVDSQMAWLINEGVNYLTSGKQPVRRGNAHPNIVPYESFACADGHILLAVGNDSQFARFCTEFGLEGRADDPAFATNVARIANREALKEQISAVLSPLAAGAVLERCRAAGVPAGPIHTVDQALTSEQAVARRAVIEMDHPGTRSGMVRLLGNPLHFSATPVRYTHAPPRAGQDGEAVLALLEGWENAE